MKTVLKLCKFSEGNTKAMMTSEGVLLATLKSWQSPSRAQRVRAYACVRVSVRVCVLVCVRVCVPVCLDICMCARACACMFVRVHVCLCARVSACVFVRVYMARVYLCSYVRMCNVYLRVRACVYSCAFVFVCVYVRVCVRVCAMLPHRYCSGVHDAVLEQPLLKQA